MDSPEPTPDAPKRVGNLVQASGARVVPWEQFATYFRANHKQGEHVAIVGQTGSGKSVLGLSLCKIIGSRMGKDRRPARVVILSVKPRDDTVTSLGWPILKKWPPAYGQEHCIVWPRGGAPDGYAERQRRVFRPVLNTIYQEGGQTLYIDEEAYFEENLPDGLGLAAIMSRYWTMARSNKLTLIAGTQRPRHVSRSMWSEASWLCISPPDDLDDLKRVAELSGAKRQVLALCDPESPVLQNHEFLIIQRQRGKPKILFITEVR